MTDPRLRFRVYVAGQLAVETWIDCLDADRSEQAEAAAELHAAVTNAAAAGGKLWMTEIYDPDAPLDQAYLRFGTDRSGMTWPVQRAITDLRLPGD